MQGPLKTPLRAIATCKREVWANLICLFVIGLLLRLGGAGYTNTTPAEFTMTVTADTLLLICGFLLPIRLGYALYTLLKPKLD